MASALGHLRVVDLADLRGALAGRILADLGADVVRIEGPGADPGSLLHRFRHLGKRGVVHDLERPAGRERLARLCDRADVVIENLDARDPRRALLSPDAIRKRHPHLVHVTMRDLGADGPRAGWRLEPLPAFAASGALWASGFPDRPPCWLPGFQAHDCASILAVAGALAAVLSGGGQTVEVSVQEAALASLAPWAIVQPDYSTAFPLLPRSTPRDADEPVWPWPSSRTKSQ